MTQKEPIPPHPIPDQPRKNQPLSVAIELAGIVDRLHCKGIVHKDIHAGNIIVCTDQVPRWLFLPKRVNWPRLAALLEEHPGL